MTEAEGGLFQRMRRGLNKTSTKLRDGLRSAVLKENLSQLSMDRLEDTLIAADLGVDNARNLVTKLSGQRFNSHSVFEEAKETLISELDSIFAKSAREFAVPADMDEPFVAMFVGVNGSGKTTTIGKLAKQLRSEGKSVMVVAADTFRAAAVEQLRQWSVLAEVDFFARDRGSDPAGVVWAAIDEARRKAIDVVLIDTAGRLQNRDDLMAELEKIAKVLSKKLPDQQHEILLVLDATIGQNAVSQMAVFKDMIGVTGLIVTKLDGSARAGVLVNLVSSYDVPVLFAGLGEDISDLQAFDARAYASALLGD